MWTGLASYTVSLARWWIALMGHICNSSGTELIIVRFAQWESGLIECLLNVSGPHHFDCFMPRRFCAKAQRWSLKDFFVYFAMQKEDWKKGLTKKILSVGCMLLIIIFNNSKGDIKVRNWFFLNFLESMLRCIPYYRSFDKEAGSALVPATSFSGGGK